MGSETPVGLQCADVEAALGLDGLGRAELEQPMVFYRVGWDFRWLSRSAVVDRLCGEQGAVSIVDDRRSAEDPPELDEFLAALSSFVAPDGDSGGLGDATRGLAFALGKKLALQFREAGDGGSARESDAATREVMVLPGGWVRGDTWAALQVALGLGAAMVLPPEEGAWAWTVVWSKPTLLVAGFDQLAALKEEISTLRRRKQKRALRKLRWVGATPSPAVMAEEDGCVDSRDAHAELDWLRSLGANVWVANPNRPEPRKL